MSSSKWLGVLLGSIGYTIPISWPASFLLLWALGLSATACVCVGVLIFFMRREEWSFKRHRDAIER